MRDKTLATEQFYLTVAIVHFKIDLDLDLQGVKAPLDFGTYIVSFKCIKIK